MCPIWSKEVANFSQHNVLSECQQLCHIFKICCYERTNFKKYGKNSHLSSLPHQTSNILSQIIYICMYIVLKAHHTHQDQYELHLKRWKNCIFCKSTAGPPSEAYAQQYSFDGRIKLIICQIRHELSVTIYEILDEKNVKWRTLYYNNNFLTKLKINSSRIVNKKYNFIIFCKNICLYKFFNFHFTSVTNLIL